MCRCALLAMLLGAGLLSAPGAGAESAASGERPRIGLVLSGGGARGAAHIGVLEVLEELQIPIDYITGTSMGAIVGGFYAAGYSPAELEAEITGIDWTDIFEDQTNRRDLSFRRKQDTLNFLTEAKLGFKNGRIQFPKGLVQGQKLGFELQRLALPVWEVHDFDELRLPFRASTTDIATGKAVILGSGNLATAIRASMAVPGAFAPVDLNGQLLVDGMVANNIPIDVVQEMGADIVIAVDVGTPPLGRDEIESVLQVTGQVLTLLMLEGTEGQLRRLDADDVLLKPVLGALTTADFQHVGQAIDIGRASAQEAVQQLGSLSVGDEEWQRYLERQRLPPTRPPFITSVTVVNNSDLAPSVLGARLRVKPNERLDVAKLKKDIQRIFGVDIFERVDFLLLPAPGGADLVIRTFEKSWGSNNLRFGLNVEEDFDETSIYNFAVQATIIPANRLGAEWRNIVQFGNNTELSTEFYQPIDASSQWFVAPFSSYRVDRLNLFQGDDRVAKYRVRTTRVGLELGRSFGNVAELRVGFGFFDQRASPLIGQDRFPIEREQSGAYSASFRIDTLDDTNFPRAGGFFDVTFQGIDEALGATEDLNLIETTALLAHTWGRNTLLAKIRFDSQLTRDPRRSASFGLGGFLDLSGYADNQLIGSQLGYAGLIGYRQIAAPALFNFQLPVYLGASVEAGDVWQTRDAIFDSVRFAGSLFVGADTFLGPLYVGYGWGEGGNNSAYLFLGQAF